MRKLFKPGVMALAAAFMLTACQLPFGLGSNDVKEDPSGSLLSAMSKLSEVTKSTMQANLDINLEDAANPDQNLTGKVALMASSDTTDPANSKGEATLDISGEMDGQSLSIDGLQFITADPETMYFRIDNVQTPYGSPQAFGLDITDQWFSLTADDVMEAAGEYGIDSETTQELQSLQSETLTPEQINRLTEILTKYQFFDEVSYEGTEKVGDVNTYKVKATGLNPEQFFKMLDELMAYLQEVAGEELGMTDTAERYDDLSDEDKAEMADELNKLNFEMTAWIGQDDGYLHKLAGTTGMDENGTKLTLTGDITWSKIGEDVNVSAPEDSQDFLEVIMPMVEGLVSSSGLDSLVTGLPTGLGTSDLESLSDEDLMQQLTDSGLMEGLTEEEQELMQQYLQSN